MAQTNDDKLSLKKKVVIKETKDKIFDEYRFGEKEGYAKNGVEYYVQWRGKTPLVVEYQDANINLKLAIQKARLAALDDCKTLLERVLSETPYHIGSSFDILRAKEINKALAELEALRKKVET